MPRCITYEDYTKPLIFYFRAKSKSKVSTKNQNISFREPNCGKFLPNTAQNFFSDLAEWTE